MDDLILSRIKGYVPEEDYIYFTSVCIQWNNIPHEFRRRKFCRPQRSLSQFIEFYGNIIDSVTRLKVIDKFFTFGRFELLSLPMVEQTICDSLAVSEDYHNKIMYTTLKKGNLCIVKKLMRLGCSLPRDSVRYGCYSGNIDVLHFLICNGFRLGNLCYNYCIQEEHDYMIDYFMDGFLPWNFEEMYSKPLEYQFMMLVAKHGKPETMRRCIDYGLICITGYSLEKAILFDRLDMVKTLIDCGVEYTEYDNNCNILVLAVINSNLDMVKYLHLHGYKIGDIVREEAIMQEKFDIVEYIDNLV